MANRFTTTQLKVSINAILPNGWNCNVQDAKTFEKEKISIQAHGFIQPILVRELDKDIYEIIDGFHRWTACKELGYTEILVENLGKIDEKTAKLLTISLNNLRGKDDIIKRAKILRDLDEGQLALLPFDRKEIDEEMKLLDFDFSQFESAEVPDTAKEQLEKILARGLALDNDLRRFYADISQPEVRALIEGYFSWFRAFKEKIN